MFILESRVDGKNIKDSKVMTDLETFRNMIFGSKLSYTFYICTYYYETTKKSKALY